MEEADAKAEAEANNAELVDELGRYKEAYQELEQEAMVRFWPFCQVLAPKHNLRVKSQILKAGQYLNMLTSLDVTRKLEVQG